MEVSFSREETLKRKLKMVDFLFFFSIFLLVDLELGFNIIFTNCHTLVTVT